jgi:PAS domain S-box-containing protein
MTNMGGKLTYINPAFLELWGYDREGVVLGRPYTELWKGETENVVIMACAKGSWEGDLIALRKDGSKFNARLSTSLIMGKTGPSQLVAVAEPEN